MGTQNTHENVACDIKNRKLETTLMFTSHNVDFWKFSHCGILYNFRTNGTLQWWERANHGYTVWVNFANLRRRSQHRRGVLLDSIRVNWNSQCWSMAKRARGGLSSLGVVSGRGRGVADCGYGLHPMASRSGVMGKQVCSGYKNFLASSLGFLYFPVCVCACVLVHHEVINKADTPDPR